MLVNCIPAWIRFGQCIRRYKDTGESFPHLANAGKYSTTFFVVIAKVLLKKYKGKIINIHSTNSPPPINKVLFLMTAMYT